jgi:hypothetical protein
LGLDFEVLSGSGKLINRVLSDKTISYFLVFHMISDSHDLYNQYTQELFNLEQSEKVIAEYIWIDGSGITLRSKARTLDKKVTSIADIPEWNYDGSSTY